MWHAIPVSLLATGGVMSLVSVIIPTYRAARWVADTIDSVSAQSYRRLELIVVDDGSPDDTVAVVRDKLTRDFRHPWHLIELGDNRGPSAARNVGLRHAGGEWVQYLDSDDFMAPDKLAQQMAHCAQAASDVAYVYSPWRRCYYDAGRITWEGGQIDPDMRGRASIMCLVGGGRPLHSAGLARRSALERIGGFDETLRFWECEEVTFRLAEAGRLERVPMAEPAYCWRMHRDKIYIGAENARYRSAPVALGWIEQIRKAAGRKPLAGLGLSEADRRDLLDDCTTWARLLYVQDRAAFRQYLSQARQLAPDIAPNHPFYATWLARHFGYEAAERIAKLVRKPRALARKTLQTLGLKPPLSVFDLN
jgi:glycosyltransferase involved in cell wall biosynthesis